MVRRGHERTFGWNIENPSDRVILLVLNTCYNELKHLRSTYTAVLENARFLCRPDGLLDVAVQYGICDILTEENNEV